MANRWKFSGSLTDLPKNCVFFQWVLEGRNISLSADSKLAQVSRKTTRLAQNTITSWLSDRQVTNQKSKTLRFTKDMPQQLALGLAIRQAYRGKNIIKMLHGFGVMVSYERPLCIETQLAKAATERILLN